MNSEPIIPQTLADVKRIEEGGISVSSRDDLLRIIEFPLLEACQKLYDKNIQTVMSSANTEGGYYIDFDGETLSEENRKILFEIFGGVECTHIGNKYIQVRMGENPKSVSEVIEWGKTIAETLKYQKLTWGGFSIEDLESMYGGDYEGVDTIQYWIDSGYFYNATLELFFPTEELYQKSLN